MLGWRDDYLLGIKQIDDQHKKLFEIAGNVFSLLNDELKIDKYDEIVELIRELKDYAVFHFESEEEYMRSIGYRQYFLHKKEHNNFIEKVNDIDLNAVDEKQDTYLREILQFIIEWISGHILQTDRQYAKG